MKRFSFLILSILFSVNVFASETSNAELRAILTSSYAQDQKIVRDFVFRSRQFNPFNAVRELFFSVAEAFDLKSIKSTTYSAAASANFTVPKGVAQVLLLGCGAGGGGGGGSNTSSPSGAGAGGQGSVPTFMHSVVTPGSTAAYVIGTAGAAGTTNNVGGNGTATSFASVSWPGGYGGGKGTGSTGVGGLASTVDLHGYTTLGGNAGSDCNGSATVTAAAGQSQMTGTGGAAGTGTAECRGGGGGSGWSGNGGAGGVGGSSGSAAGAATGNCAGGGGGGGGSSGPGAAGTIGRDGKLIVMWISN